MKKNEAKMIDSVRSGRYVDLESEDLESNEPEEDEE